MRQGGDRLCEKAGEGQRPEGHTGPGREADAAGLEGHTGPPGREADPVGILQTRPDVLSAGASVQTPGLGGSSGSFMSPR